MREVPGSSPGNRLFFCFLEAPADVRGGRRDQGMQECFGHDGVDAESEQQDDSGDVDWIAELAWKD